MPPVTSVPRRRSREAAGVVKPLADQTFLSDLSQPRPQHWNEKQDEWKQASSQHGLRIDGIVNQCDQRQKPTASDHQASKRLCLMERSEVLEHVVPAVGGCDNAEPSVHIWTVAPTCVRTS